MNLNRYDASTGRQLVKAMPDGHINAAAVVPSDTVDLASPAMIYVGTAGDLKVTTLGGQTILIDNIANAAYLPIMVTRVWATGQTGAIATDVLALWS